VVVISLFSSDGSGAPGQATGQFQGAGDPAAGLGLVRSGGTDAEQRRGETEGDAMLSLNDLAGV